jgi:integrase
MAVNSHRFSLYKRSGIYYIGYYQNGHRRWKSTGARHKPDALKALTRFQALLQERIRSKSFTDFCIDFLDFSDANHARKTTEIYRHTFLRFSKLVPDLSLDEITPHHIDRYKAQRLKQVRPISVNVELRALRSAFNAANRWKLMRHNPCNETTLADVSETPPLFFSVTDFSRLIENIREVWLKEMVIFGVLTGMRRGEIINLRWSNVDLKNRVLHIQGNPTFKTKQGKRRTIPLNETAVFLLSSKQGKSPSQYVFTLNDEPLKGNWVTHLFKRYVRKVGLDNDNLRFHSLRHTFASWLVQGGATLYEVQKLLGHSSSRVTEIYSHLQPEHLHNTVNRIEKYR